ncbi:protein ecdysoneless homolog [Ostrinia furnacalis]|nr:protein ecdysoneless homolog [Ostrinia furnacalis]
MLMHSKLIRSVKHKISAEAKRDELGFKITFGFQMLMKTAAKDIFCSKEFIKYKNNLKENGYFRNNIEHSKEYNYLLEKAKNYFFEMECPVSTYVSNNVSSIMATGEFLKCKESLKEHNKTDSSLNEDNDDWLSIEPSQLNNMLNNRYGNSVKFNNDDIVTPETITTKLTDFLKQSSDFEGVDTKEKNDLESKNINFDANEFINCLEKMMDLVSVDMHSSSETDSDFEDNLTDAELDEELANKLKSYDVNRSDGNKVMFNLTQSIKEEGVSGPSSNLLSSIGINKTDLLDSDDD